MSDWLEVRIPISPLDHYFNRVHLIAHSIRSLGGRYADVHVRVTVGADQEPEDLHRRMPWSREAGIDWVWADREEFRQWRGTEHEYIATMMERFRPPFSTRQVLMLDADVLVMREFDELAASLEQAEGIAGVMAHVSPFPTPSYANASEWARLLELAGVSTPLDKQYSGWGIMAHDPAQRFGPTYFNTGVILASSSVLERLYRPYIECLDLVRGAMDTYFFEQIALTLALARAGISATGVPLRYNFPNQIGFDRAYQEELDQVRFLHFLRTDAIQREADFETLGAMSQLTSRSDLTGSNEALRRRISELMPAVQAANRQKA